MEDDRPVTIDVETATETVTREEDVHRIRREAGVEAGDPPPRGEPSGEASEVEQDRPRGSGADGDHDHSIDRALDAHAREETDQPSGVPDGAARDDEQPA